MSSGSAPAATQAGKKPWYIEDEEEAEAEAKAEANEVPPPLPRRPVVSGRSWRSQLDAPAPVSTSGPYDRLKIEDAGEVFECALASGSSAWLLPMLSALMSASGVDRASLHQAIVWQRSAQAPVLFWQLAENDNEVRKLAGITLVTARVELGRVALCVYRGEEEAERFVSLTRGFLDNLTWTDDVQEDGAQTIALWKEPKGRRGARVVIPGPSNESDRYPAGEKYIAKYLEGVRRQRVDYSTTERVSERGWQLSYGQKLRALKEYELIKEGDANDVLVRATYRSVSSGAREEATLTREGTARYRISRGGGSQGFATPRDVDGPFVVRAKLRAAYHGPQTFQVKVLDFTPEASLLTATTLTLSRHIGHQRGGMTFEVRGQKSESRFNEWGTIFQVGDFPKGAAVQLEVLDSHGKLFPSRHDKLPRPLVAPVARGEKVKL